MNAAKFMEKLESKREAGKKEQVIRELSALLQTVPTTRKNARAYIQNAIDYIEQH